MSDFDDNESPFQDIESRLGNIESQLYTIESKVNDLPNSIFWFAFCIFIGWSLATSDFSCSIPAHKPFKQLTTDYAASRGYHIVYNERFSGEANYNPNDQSILFYIINKSKEPIELNDLRTFMWTNDGTGYGLKIEHKSMMDGLGNSQDFLNPESSITFQANLFGYSPTLQQIQGFSVVTHDKEKIRFGYKDIGWLNELRWLIAGNCRSN